MWNKFLVSGGEGENVTRMMTRWWWVNGKKKLTVIQGIKDRSKIRDHLVTRKQGYGDEGETKEGSLRRTRRWVSVGWRGDPGEIQGRSIDLGVLVFRGVGGGRRVEGQGQQSVPRVREIKGGQWGGFYGCLVGSDKGDWGVRGKKM